jgi:hypothetical protein
LNYSCFFFKGAERKTRDEERRAAKRKMTATGRKKMDELYHPATERSEFYTMSDLAKPPVLFTPAEDIDKVKHHASLLATHLSVSDNIHTEKNWLHLLFVLLLVLHY